MEAIFNHEKINLRPGIMVVIACGSFLMNVIMIIGLYKSQEDE